VSEPADPARPEEPRPPLGSWPRLYALVLFDLLLVIALCGALSRVGR
jgi:hypothetical protein